MRLFSRSAIRIFVGSRTFGGHVHDEAKPELLRPAWQVSAGTEVPDADVCRTHSSASETSRRCADKQAIADKELVDFSCFPSDPEIGAGWDAFITSVQRPQAQTKIMCLMELGLQTNPEVETRLGTATLGH